MSSSLFLSFPNSTESQQSPPTLEVTPPDCQPEEADEMEEQAEGESLDAKTKNSRVPE